MYAEIIDFNRMCVCMLFFRWNHFFLQMHRTNQVHTRTLIYTDINHKKINKTIDHAHAE